MATPQIDVTTATEMLATAQQKAFEVSQGKLNNFSIASPVTALLEAVASIASNVQVNINSLASNIESNRIAIFNIAREGGKAATAILNVTLDALYSDPFYLPKGYRFEIGSIPFETTEDLTISPFASTGTVSAIALVTGTIANMDADTQVSFPSISKLQSLALIEATKGGTEEETSDEWSSRIYAQIRQRDSLISEADFENAAKDFLGTNSVAIAVGRLKNKSVYSNGYVSLFGLNGDGSELSTSQQAALQDELTSRAAMALVQVYSLEMSTVNVTAIVNILLSVSPEAIASDVNRVIRNYLKPGLLVPGSLLLNKAIEYLIQGIVGVEIGAVSVTLNGYAQPQSMPNRWTIPKAGKIVVACTNASNNTFNFEFE